MIRPALFSLRTASPALTEPCVLLIHETPDQIALHAGSGEAGMSYCAAYADGGKSLSPSG